MGKKVTVRKSGSSLVITLPSSIAELMNIEECSEMEYEPLTQDSLQLKKVKK